MKSFWILVKYRVNPDPIMRTTRKLYEKQKVVETQGTRNRITLFSFSTNFLLVENTRQNQSKDPDRSSDDDEDSNRPQACEGKSTIGLSKDCGDIQAEKNWSQSKLFSSWSN